MCCKESQRWKKDEYLHPYQHFLLNSSYHHIVFILKFLKFAKFSEIKILINLFFWKMGKGIKISEHLVSMLAFLFQCLPASQCLHSKISKVRFLLNTYIVLQINQEKQLDEYIASMSEFLVHRLPSSKIFHLKISKSRLIFHINCFLQLLLVPQK